MGVYDLGKIFPLSRLPHLNELVFGAEFRDQHVLPIADACERHTQFAADECVCIFRQALLQAGAQHFNYVECGMQGAEVALTGLLSDLDHILATFLYKMKTQNDKLPTRINYMKTEKDAFIFMFYLKIFQGRAVNNCQNMG